jgi:beta-lactamase class A
MNARAILPLLFFCAACAAETGESTDDAEEDLSAAAPLDLDAAVAFLGKQVARRSPGTRLSISVRVLGTNERADYQEHLPRPSASSAKAIWTAAALSKHDASAVAGDALPVFRVSDNDAAGRVIDLAGGAHAVNVFYTHAGMTDSALLHWDTGGHTRHDPAARDRIGGDNYFSSDDAVEFLTRLDGGKLLTASKKATLESWMTQSPNSGTGGWLAARLPEPAKSKAMHKAGWLPPECCSSRTLNEIGIVPTASGKKYAVAILTSHGDDWYGKQAPFVEYASCVIYRAVQKAPALKCD